MPYDEGVDRPKKPRRVNLTDYAVLHAPTQASLMRRAANVSAHGGGAQTTRPVGQTFSEEQLRAMAPNVRADWPGWSGVSGVISKGGGGFVSPFAPRVVNLGQDTLSAIDRNPYAMQGAVSHELDHVRAFRNLAYRIRNTSKMFELAIIDKVLGGNRAATYNFNTNERRANLVGGGYGNPNAPGVAFGGYRTLNAMPPSERWKFQNFLVPGAPRQRGGK